MYGLRWRGQAILKGSSPSLRGSELYNGRDCARNRIYIVRHLLVIALALFTAGIHAGIHAAELPLAPRELGPSVEPNLPPLIVADGTDFVVMWESSGPPRFARIRHSEEILFTGDFGRPGHIAGAIAGPNGSVLVAFSDAEGIHVATITHGGDVRMSEVVAPSFAAMAWNGSKLLIVTVIPSVEPLWSLGLLQKSEWRAWLQPASLGVLVAGSRLCRPRGGRLKPATLRSQTACCRHQAVCLARHSLS
jgi:hypothetical protein